jgi:hypothetical protein
LEVNLSILSFLLLKTRAITFSNTGNSPNLRQERKICKSLFQTGRALLQLNTEVDPRIEPALHVLLKPDKIFRQSWPRFVSQPAEAFSGLGQRIFRHPGNFYTRILSWRRASCTTQWRFRCCLRCLTKIVSN